MRALMLTALLSGVALWVVRPSLRRAPIPIPCTGCGTTLARLGAFGLCTVCLDRQERAEQSGRTRRAEWHRSERAAQRAERERRRLAERLPVLTVGSIYRNEHGELVFEDFVFQRPADPDGKVPPIVTLTGRQPSGALICGWEPAELHALAHGAACTCLNR